jgi:hypothetical protein
MAKGDVLRVELPAPDPQGRREQGGIRPVVAVQAGSTRYCPPHSDDCSIHESIRSLALSLYYQGRTLRNQWSHPAFRFIGLSTPGY